ncbi:hypothetical protein [Paenibacillus ehimensis]|uniref:Uncharacterized protein n=1 Tax=Paenibacillus ehimensis TaxID=79264 RepID=A0ABT8VJ09_9BACL|nr:hypothetical protein [Paenibacillus ehimensis]MDO3680981.1 hypothetical protein [Paenibacillus ehimensis]
MNPDASYASKPTFKEEARKQTGSKIGRRLKPYLFILPCIVLVLLFNYYPFVKTFWALRWWTCSAIRWSSWGWKTSSKHSGMSSCSGHC